jgi:putative ABC transport system substrate-binding protein
MLEIRRREFIATLGGAMAWPVAARTQQPTRPVIGYLSIGSPVDSPGFRKGLSEMGYVEGRNVSMESRSAKNDFTRLPEMAADLVHNRVVVIVAVGTAAATCKRPSCLASRCRQIC